MSHALAFGATAPVLTWRALVNGMPVTDTVVSVPAPSMRVKQVSGSAGVSDDGSAHANAASDAARRIERTSIGTTMVAGLGARGESSLRFPLRLCGSAVKG